MRRTKLRHVRSMFIVRRLNAYRSHRSSVKAMKRSGQYHDVLTMSGIISAILYDLRRHIFWHPQR